MSRIVVVVLCDVASPTADGFVHRNELVIRALRRDHEVVVVGLAPDRGRLLDQVDVPLIEPAAFVERRSHWRRLQRLAQLRLGRLGFTGVERRLEHQLEALSPDVIFSMTFRDVALVRAMRRVAPTVHFVEERIGRVGGTRTSRLPAILSTTLEKEVFAQAAGLPAVAVLGPSEVAWTRRRFASPVMIVPHGIDIAFWTPDGPRAADAGPLDVLCIGNHLLERNAAGLADVIDALRATGWPPGVRIRVISATGYHPRLAGKRDDVVILDGEVDDPRPIYRSCVATLVPATRAVGVKNGILQGWAMGCPVLTTTESAATVGGIDDHDLLIADDPEGLAALVRAVSTRPDRASLAEAGRRHLLESFSPAAHDAAVSALVDVALRNGVRRKET